MSPSPPTQPTPPGSIRFYDADMVGRLLDYAGCTAAVRDAMIALSMAGREQPLRQILWLGEGRAFGVMPGDLLAASTFGAKLVSVYPDSSNAGRSRHRGIVAAFDADDGMLTCLADAEAVTAIRTACATAAATDALARHDARVLTILGTGTQAASHLHALRDVRDWAGVRVWGRSFDQATTLASRMAGAFNCPVIAVGDAREAAQADVICTVTGSRTPVLFGAWVRPGTHVNLVGSSSLGPIEADAALVAAARYIADHRPGALAQAAELAAARDTGLVGDDHVVGEIGDVFAGRLAGREAADQITLYKSLGHVVQDLAATAYLHRRATGEIG